MAEPDRREGNPRVGLMDLARLSIEELVFEVVNRSGGDSITVEQVRELIEDGAPVESDGSIHLVKFTAWLCSQRTRK